MRTFSRFRDLAVIFSMPFGLVTLSLMLILGPLRMRLSEPNKSRFKLLQAAPLPHAPLAKRLPNKPNTRNFTIYEVPGHPDDPYMTVWLSWSYVALHDHILTPYCLTFRYPLLECPSCTPCWYLKLTHISPFLRFPQKGPYTPLTPPKGSKCFGMIMWTHIYLTLVIDDLLLLLPQTNLHTLDQVSHPSHQNLISLLRSMFGGLISTIHFFKRV